MLWLFEKKLIFYFVLSLTTVFVAAFFINDSIIKHEFLTASITQFEDQESLEVLESEPAISEEISDTRSFQDQLDEIQEKLDIIQQKVNELVIQQSSLPVVDQLEVEDVQEDVIDELEIDEQDTQDEPSPQEISCVGQININTASLQDLNKITQVGPATAQKIIDARLFYSLDDLLKVGGIGPITLQKIKDQGCAFVEPGLTPPPATAGGGGGGGSSVPTYPKILISEVQIKPTEQRFIELYNPNSSDVDLTDWYLQRKDSNDISWGSLISHTRFESKIIPANGYFFISRELDNSDILYDFTLSQNNFLALKNPSGDIVDQVSWTEVTDNLSWCYDFNLCSPTPRAQNIAYVEPPPPTDTDAPEVVFNLAPTQTALEFSVNFTITDISTTTTPSGLASFVFRWSEDGQNWHPDDTPTTTGDGLQTRNFTGEDGKIYYFQVKVTDVASNVSDWLPSVSATTTTSVPSEPKPILISKVQIEGDTTKDDWIELYNPNNFDVYFGDYKGSYLRLVKRAKTSASDYTIKSWSGDTEAKITANSYYLWASSTNEEYSSSVGADVSTKQNISSDNGIALRMGSEDTGEIVDAVGWGDFANVLFEGQSYPENPGPHQNISRTNNADTNDNSIDFIIYDTPTPSS